MTQPIIRTRIVRDTEWNEFRIEAYGMDGSRIPEADCFEENRGDAEDTAAAMVRPFAPWNAAKSRD